MFSRHRATTFALAVAPDRRPFPQLNNMMYRTTLAFCLLFAGSSLLRGEQKTEKTPTVNFTDHVLPIFRQHCLKCHNANDAEAGLAIDSYGGLMEGGGSGDAVSQGDAAGSRLYQVMTHAEEPAMPPEQDPLPKEKLEIIRQWIDGGLLENSGSKVRKRKGPSLSFATTDASGKPSVIAMPEKVWRVPVVTSQRTAAASAIATSPWAPLVAIAGQKQVTLYNTDSSELVGIIPYPEGIPQVLKFSLDGAYLLVAGGTHASNGVASLYDVKTGDRLFSVGDELDIVFGASINDNLSNIAMGGPQRLVRIFDTGTGEQRFELKKHTDWVYCVEYSPDGVLVASGDRAGGLHVWEADTGRLYLDLVGHKAAIRGISWRADSNVLVSASEDGTAKVWEMNAGRQLKSFNTHGGGATGVMMAKDGRIVTCGKDRTVKLWKADGAAIATFPAFTEAALEAAITHDGSKVIGGDWNGRTVMWNIADPKQSQELAANPPRLEDQQTVLANRVAELDKTLASAVANQTNQQTALQNVNTGHQGLVAKLAETKTMLAKANADKAAAEKRLGELKAEKTAEESKLKTVQTRVAGLDKQIKDATAVSQAEQKLLAAATARRDAANKEKAGIVAALAKVRAEHDKLKSDALASLSAITSRELDVAAKEQVFTTKEAEAEAGRKAAAAQVAGFNTQIASAAEVIKQANGQLVAGQAELKTTVAAIAALPAKIDAAKKVLDAKQAEVANLQKQLAESQDDIQKKSLTEMLTAAQAESNTLTSAKAAVDQQLAGANSKKPLHEKLISALTAKIATTANGQKDLSNKRDGAQRQVDQFTSARNASAKEKEAFVKLSSQINSEVEEAARVKQEAVNKMAELVAQQSQLTLREKEFNAAATREQAALNAAQAKLAELQKTIDATKPTLATAQAEMQAVTKQVAQLGDSLKAQPGVIAKVDTQLKQHTAAVPNFEKQIVAAKKKVDETGAALATAKSAADAARANVAATKTRLDGIKAELVAFQSLGAKLAAEYEAAEAVAAQKRTSVDPEATAATKITASIAARGEQLNQLAQSLAKLQAQLTQMKETQATDQQTLDATQAKLKALEAEAEEAEAESDAKKQKVEFFKSVYGA
jgi:predicted  nucleic acid-binding Zn-ribbon protein